MINSYTNSLNEKISSRITDNTIMELQKELLLLSEDNLNVYDFIKYSQNKEKDPKKTYLYNTQENNSANNYNLVLKLFLQDLIMRNSSDLQVLKNKKKNNIIKNLNLHKTANNKLYVNNKNEYFSFNDDELVERKDIIIVLNTGEYIIREKIKNTQYYLQKKIDLNEEIIEFSMVDANGNPYRNTNLISSTLNLRKEYVKKFKRNGYYGNSNDFVANIMNLFFQPVESGYYMDTKFNFYKWNNVQSCFIIDNRDGLVTGSVNLADYEIANMYKVIRTDYNGAGLIN